MTTDQSIALEEAKRLLAPHFSAVVVAGLTLIESGYDVTMWHYGTVFEVDAICRVLGRTHEVRHQQWEKTHHP